MRRFKKGKIKQKVNQILNLEEKKIFRFLVITSAVFLVLFLAIICFYNSFFRKFVYPNPVAANLAFEQQLDNMVQGYPIESMVPEIAMHDKKVAALMISIAKKESDWGKRVPVFEGKDCYNYWGYRGENPVGSGGHSCFQSRSEAVSVVARRLSELVYGENLDSPQKLVVWKCGDACSSDNPMSVRKWIKDVSYYYHKILD